MNNVNALLITVRSDIGGGPKHVLDLLQNAHANLNYFICSPMNGEYALGFKKSAKGIIEIPFRSFNLIKVFKIHSFCKKHNIEIIHSHGRGAGVYSRILKLFGYKVIHTFHGIHIQPGIIGKIKLFTDRILKFFTDKYICVSKGEFEEAKKYKVCFENKTRVIHNGVQINSFHAPKENKKLIFGSLSRLNHQKGIDILIDYISNFTAEHQFDFEIHIAGDGEDRSFLESRIEKMNLSQYIKLLGQTVKPDEFLNSLDVYLSFARFEGLPLAVLEAMSNSLPCILSNVVGNNDIVNSRSVGALFELNDYQSFELEFIKIIQDKDYRGQLAKEGHQRVVKEFSIQKMIQETTEVYQ